MISGWGQIVTMATQDVYAKFYRVATYNPDQTNRLQNVLNLLCRTTCPRRLHARLPHIPLLHPLAQPGRDNFPQHSRTFSRRYWLLRSLGTQ